MKICLTWTTLCCVVMLVILTRTKSVESAYCSNTQFKCDNNNCIPLIWKCDDDDDCGDNSDELSCPVKTCTDDEFQCTNGTKCIPNRWKCDGDVDCEDSSDEDKVTCDKLTCTEDQWSCGKNQPCIPKEWRCDQQSDCKNGADEKNCEPTTCEADQFTCANAHCISMKWLCDQDDDCGDNSDEEGPLAQCGEPTCASGEFKCTNSSRCIPAHWQCDGDSDCLDGSDEPGECSALSKNSCRENEFQCTTSKLCIHKSWKCDGDKDCPDESDENECPHTTCRAADFTCANGQCVPGILQCDGNPDCNDGSDEQNCKSPAKQCDPDNHFDCNGDGTQCIPLDGACNGKQECNNGADETENVCNKKQECKANIHRCSDRCIFNAHKTRCACHKGFQLTSDDHSCEDIDECTTIPGLCSQVCENVKGHYKCSCQEGYSIDPKNSHGCRMNKNNATLVFSNRQDVRRVDIRQRNYTTVVNATRSAVALDFDIRGNAYFYSDSAEERIYHITTLGEKVELDVKVQMPDGIAYDWVHGNLYWTDTGKDVIGVISIKNKIQRTLLDSTDGLDEPRSIVVDPINGWMYWSDWGNQAKIQKAGMDGSHSTTIVTTNIMWPNGITIDYISQRLYWVDAKLHTISSSDLNGQFQYNVLTSMSALQHPFAITVFEDYVYWTDWELQSIQKVIKMNPYPNSNRSLDINPVLNNLYSPMDLHIYHPERQPHGENHCAANPCQDHQFCLPAPVFNAGSARVSCLCPDGSKGCDDGLPTKKPLTPTSRPPSPTKTSASPNVSPNGNTGANTSEQGVGTIAAIVSGAVAGVLIIGIVIGVLVWRYYSRKNVKSMNFDNPVYRKTTEDQFILERNQYQPANRLASHNTPQGNAQFQRLNQDEDSDPSV